MVEDVIGLLIRQIRNWYKRRFR